MDTDDDTRDPAPAQPLRLQWVRVGGSSRWQAQGRRFRLAVTTYRVVRWSVHTPGVSWDSPATTLHMTGEAPTRVAAKRMAEAVDELLTETLKLLDLATTKLVADPGPEQLTIDQPTTQTED